MSNRTAGQMVGVEAAARGERRSRGAEGRANVQEGLECGIGLVDYKDIKDGDVIEILAEVEV